MTTSRNPWAIMPIKDYILHMEPFYRWQHNTEGGITLQEEMVAYIDEGDKQHRRMHINWMSVANVYKAKRGNRYIAEVNGYPKLFRFHTLREAMRMAKFLHQTRSK